MLDFIGIGTSKSATSWIAKFLQNHPDVYLPSHKELHYFNGRSGNYTEDLRYLKILYSEQAHLLKGEFTPRYMISELALKRIRKHCPNAKLIISVREPVERALSQHKFFVNNLMKEPILDPLKAFADFYYEDYIEKSLYGKHLENVYALFDKSKVLVVDYYEIKLNPEKVVDEVFSFLRLEPIQVPLRDRVNVTETERPSIIENYINRIKLNIKYQENFRHQKHFGTLDFFSNVKGARKLLNAIEVVGKTPIRIEKILINNKVKVPTKTQREEVFFKYFKDDFEVFQRLQSRSFQHWYEQ